MSFQAGVNRKQAALTFLSVIFIATVVAWAHFPIVKWTGIAPGTDTGSFMFTGKLIGDSLRDEGQLPIINRFWYNSLDNQVIPPLIHLPITGLYLIFGDILLAGRLLHPILFFLIATSMFLVLNRRYSLVASATGALIFAFAPIVVAQGLEAGSYPRLLALVFLPPAFHITSRTPKEKRRKWELAILAVALALSFLAHPMFGAMTVIFLGVHLLARTLIDRGFGLAGLGFFAKGLAAAMALTAWYLVPFLAERAGWVTVPASALLGQSIKPSETLRWLGLPAALAALTVMIPRSQYKLAVATAVAGAFALLFSYGPNTPIFNLVPISSIYPFVGIVYAAFALAWLAAAGSDALLSGEVRLFKKAVLVQASAAIAVVVAVTASIMTVRDAALRTTSGPPFKESDRALAEALANLENQGRLMPMKYPFGHLLYWIWTVGEKETVEGWYYSVTPTGRQIALAYDALDYGYTQYALDKFRRWNVRYFVATPALGPTPRNSLASGLRKDGFEKENVASEHQLYVSNRPSSYLVPVGERTLVIGKYSMQAAALLPDTIEGGSEFIEDYEEILPAFDSLLLYGFTFRDKNRAEDLIRGFAGRGGRVVINFVGSERTTLEKSPNFLGVTGYPVISRGPIKLETSRTGPFDRPLPLPSELVDGERRVPLKNYKFFKYMGLDKVSAGLAGDGDEFGVVGYKRAGDGEVYFVGPNLPFYTFLTKSAPLTKYLRRLSTPDESRDNGRLQFRARHRERQPEHHEFVYETSRTTPALASFAYSPHWRAYVDGQPIPVTNAEDLLYLELPEGKHGLTLRFEQTPVHLYASAPTLVLAALAGFWAVRLRRLGRRQKPATLRR